MGAAWVFVPCAVNVDTAEELQRRFNEAQDRDRYENGHSYSGGLGQACGLVVEARTFQTDVGAEGYLQERCQKWKEAVAVTVEKPERHFVLGAWCAS